MGGFYCNTAKVLAIEKQPPAIYSDFRVGEENISTIPPKPLCTDTKDRLTTAKG